MALMAPPHTATRRCPLEAAHLHDGVALGVAQAQLAATMLGIPGGLHSETTLPTLLHSQLLMTRDIRHAGSAASRSRADGTTSAHCQQATWSANHGLRELPAGDLRRQAHLAHKVDEKLHQGDGLPAHSLGGGLQHQVHPHLHEALSERMLAGACVQACMQAARADPAGAKPALSACLASSMPSCTAVCEQAAARSYLQTRQRQDAGCTAQELGDVLGRLVVGGKVEGRPVAPPPRQRLLHLALQRTKLQAVRSRRHASLNVHAFTCIPVAPPPRQRLLHPALQPTDRDAGWMQMLDSGGDGRL